MPQVFRNNARSTLAVALGSAGTSLEVIGLDATRFPAPSGGDFFDLTLQDATNIEIVRITARVGGVMTISARALEGTTTPATFAVGTVAGLRLTAAVAEAAINHAALAAGAHAASAISNVAAGNLAATTVQAALNELQADVDARAADLASHSAAADPHPVYTTAAELTAELAAYSTRASVQAQTNTAFTTAGTSTAYTLTPTPAITSYAAGQSFFVNFNAASGAAPTLTISGIATPPNLVKQIADGAYANIAAGDITINHRSRVTLLSATQALVERPSFSDVSTFSRTVLDDVDAPAWRATLAAQNTLVSGTNIKTVGGVTLLGGGDVPISADGAFRSVQVFTASGTYTAPAGLVRARVTVVAAGGGGGAHSTGNSTAGRGGGGGGASIEMLAAATIGATQAVTVGAGGAGTAASGANGAAGGSSSVGTLLSATGGGGGGGGATMSLGAPGVGSGGHLNISGGQGGAHVTLSGGSGGGSFMGGMRGVGISETGGAAGGGYGGGGSGSGADAVASGAGAAGVVFIEEFF